MKDYEKMTVKELIDELTGLGVKFNKKLRKAELIKLLQAETADEAATGEAPATEQEAAVDTAKAEPKTEKKKKPAAEPAEKEKSAKPKAVAKKKAGKAVSSDSGYAIIRTGGKQYQVSTGTQLRVEKINGNVGDSIELDDVLAVFDGDNVKIGQPTVEGASVSAKIVEQGKAKKVIVFKKKRRKGYRVKRGHRQLYTALEVGEINL
jgi:large subunit ribosomal protein L21